MRFERHLVPTVLLLVSALFGGVSCVTNNDGGLQRFEFQQPQMGVPFRVVLYARDESVARTTADAAFARIAELNSILSDYDYESELSRLSRTSGSGQNVGVSPDLWHVLERSQFFAEQSGGAFDITVGPAVNLWRKARREKKFPDQERLAKAREAVGYKNLILHPGSRTVELKQPGMRLDLGGIAKGYAVDEALKVLRQQGINRALVSGGGDIAVGEPPPGKTAWRIELPPLDRNGQPSEFLQLKNNAMATSGDLFQYVILDGRRYSHIVDPRTGIGLTNSSRVVVVAKDCTTADAMATSVSVLGAEEGLRLVRLIRNTSARISFHSGDEVVERESPGFRKHLE